MLEIGSLRRIGLAMCLLELVGVRPRFELLARVPDDVRGIQCGLIVARASQQLELAETVNLIQVGLSVAPDIFKAFLEGESDPWVTLEAVDSTYWEVFVRDENVLAPFLSRFKKTTKLKQGAV